MSLLLALQAPLDITGSGASSFGFTIVGNALEVFEGSGTPSFGLVDAGAALEVFEGTGAPSFGFTDVGDALEIFLGTGAPEIVLTDAGTGFVEGGAEPEPETPPNGGGWVYRDRDRGQTVRAFQRLLQQRRPAKRSQPEPQRPEEIFSYVSESTLTVSGRGQGKIHGLLRGEGASVVLMHGRGQGRIEQSAADIIRLLLSLDEI